MSDDDTCIRCGHSGYYHRLDDSKNVGPTHPWAQFRCVWPMPDARPRQCLCPEFFGKRDWERSIKRGGLRSVRASSTTPGGD